MTPKKTFSMLLLAAILCAPFTVSAQVTIGSDRAPSQWSLLDLCTREQQRALHNARMDSIQRNALVTPASPVNHRDSAQGLMLFNTDSDCLEFWSGTRWVSLCEGDTPDPCEGFDRFSATWCAVDNPTIADLTAKARAAGGRGTVVWYNAETAGIRFTNPNTPLVSGTYWAANCADATARVPVVVTLEANCARIIAGRIAAFVNVMYDFQHQRLEAFTVTGGQPTSWRWQMRVRVGANINDGTGGELLHDWRDITLPGARTPNFTIPANFMYTYAGIPRGTNNQVPNASAISVRGHRTNTVIIEFRCLMTNTNTNDYVDATLSILFIRTNTSGFGGSGNARYLTVQRGLEGTIGGGNIRLALLNLGANYDDGVGLGGFYQWGRRADGHQNAVWRKNTTVDRNNVLYRVPFIGRHTLAYDGWSGTSGLFSRNRPIMSFDEFGQIINDTPGHGSFIILPVNHTDWDWSTGVAGTGTTLPLVGNYDLWGNGLPVKGNGLPVDRANSPTSLYGDGSAGSGWSAKGRANNPCQYLGAGWRVPSAAEWGDMHENPGDDNTIGSSSWHVGVGTTGTNNTWTWRAVQANSSAFGGIVLANQNGEAVFLPSTGSRSISMGNLNSGGSTGRYWSSTFLNESVAWVLFFDENVVGAGSMNDGRVRGYPIRCVK